MFAYLADGRFKDGVDLAGKLVKNEDVGKVAQISVALDALHHGRWDAAIQSLKLRDTSDLDSLLVAHLSAWADLGAGRSKEAIRRIDDLRGASWFAAFNQYQIGLIAGYAGDLDRARAALNALISEQGSAQTSIDAYMAGAEALARLEARAGRKQQALDAVAKGLELAPSYEPLTSWKRRSATERRSPPRSPTRKGAPPKRSTSSARRSTAATGRTSPSSTSSSRKRSPTSRTPSS